MLLMILPYAGRVVLYSAAFYLVYYILLRNRAPHQASRIYLWLALILPLLLPLIHWTSMAKIGSPPPAIMLPDVIIGPDTTSVISHPVVNWLPVAYCGIAALLLIEFGARWLQLIRLLRRSDRQTVNGISIYTQTSIGPGSVSRSVFFPGTETDDIILRHELAHIHAGHRFDLLFAKLLQCICWANPIVWVVARELKMVHEFEADEMASANSPQHYTRRLLDAVFGTAHFTIAHHFFHPSLKRRVMMLQTSHHRGRRAFSLIAATVLTACLSGTAIWAQQQTKSSTVSGGTASSQNGNDPDRYRDLNAIMDAKGMVSFNEARTGIVYNRVDQVPRFNGNVGSYMAKTIVYPDAARKQGKHGRSVIRFIVNADGHVSDAHLVESSDMPMLDDEALRAVKTMPDWKPGKLHNIPVAVYVTMPVSFSLTGVEAADGC